MNFIDSAHRIKCMHSSCMIFVECDIKYDVVQDHNANYLKDASFLTSLVFCLFFFEIQFK